MPTHAKVGELHLGLGLDLNQIEVREVLGDRPDDSGRAPPTPAAEVVARINAQKERERIASQSGDDVGGVDRPSLLSPIGVDMRLSA